MSADAQHDHHHDHDAHSHEHDHQHGLWGSIADALHLPGHSHDHAGLAQDATLYDNDLAIRTIWLSLIILGVTTALQLAVYQASSSVSLLGDSVHNLVDVLNSVPLLLAFWLAKRGPTRRYTYGFGRAEDIAGLIIVASIAFSAGYILWEASQKLLHAHLYNVPWVAVASIIGFLGNEAVALLEIRVGRKIGSAALITSGVHAQADGLTSLSVLVAAIFVWLGFPVADAVIGILIAIMILFICRNTVLPIWYRLMDAVDPKLMDQAEAVIKSFPEVKQIQSLRMRWVGRHLYADAALAFESNLSVSQIAELSEAISHKLGHELGQVVEVSLSVIPHGVSQGVGRRVEGDVAVR